MSLDEYIADIVRVPMLTCEEEIILGTRVQKMMQVLRENQISEQISQQILLDSVNKLSRESKKTIKNGLRARDRMISANMRLVVAIAKKAKTTQIHLSIQDLIQEGAIGLARAAEKFEPGRGYKFSTYAYWWIRQGVVRATEYQEKAIRLPSNVQKTIRQIKDAKNILSVKLGRPPTVNEIAEEVGDNVEKIRKIILADTFTISLDSNASQADDSSSTLLELISASDLQEFHELEDSHARLDLILMLVSALSNDEQLLIKRRFGIGCEQASIKQIAEENGVSEQTIKQKQHKVISKIRYTATVMKIENFYL